MKAMRAKVPKGYGGKLNARECARVFGRLVMRPDGCWGALRNGRLSDNGDVPVQWGGKCVQIRTVFRRYFQPTRRTPCHWKGCVEPSHARRTIGISVVRRSAMP